MNPSGLESFGPVIQRVVLRTTDAARLATFYRDLLGLLPHADSGSPGEIHMLHALTGRELVTLVGDRHARPAPTRAAALFHTAFLFADLDDWRAAVKRALPVPGGLRGASDHGVSWAVYLTDPDGNGIELAWDKPAGEWPWRGDRIRMTSRALPLQGILLNGGPAPRDPGTFHIGHLHLQVTDLQVAAIYQSTLGLRVTQSDYPGVLFLARDHYHHHLALNTWHTRADVRRPDNAVGLIGWDISHGGEIAAPSPWCDPHGFLVTLLEVRPHPLTSGP